MSQMKTEPVAAKRSKTHTVYKSSNGVRLPGVTTVLGVLNKPALVPWANKLGLQGIEVRGYVDVLAQIGAMAHEMVCCHLRNEPFDTTNLSADLIDCAETCFIKYLQWEEGHKVVPLLVEAPLTDDGLGFGGTVDFYGTIDGVLTLKDLKTAKAIWPEHLYQVAAYRKLLEANQFQVDAVGILQVGRNADEGFSDRVIANCDREWNIFSHALALYKLGVGK